MPAKFIVFEYHCLPPPWLLLGPPLVASWPNPAELGIWPWEICGWWLSRTAYVYKLIWFMLREMLVVAPSYCPAYDWELATLPNTACK